MRAPRIDTLLEELVHRLRPGHERAIAGSLVAADMGISARTLRHLVEECADRGILIGSTCSGEQPGYFLINSEEDLELGTKHLRSRAFSLLHRIRAMQATAAVTFGDDAARLFDLEEVSP